MAFDGSYSDIRSKHSWAFIFRFIPPALNPRISPSFMTTLNSRDLYIAGVSQKNKVWKYHIRSRRWPRYIVLRRFRAFQQLYRQVVTLFPNQSRDILPAFPKAGLWSLVFQSRAELIERRKAPLETLLGVLDAHPILRHHPIFVEFCTPLRGQLKASTSSYISLTAIESPEVLFQRSLSAERVLSRPQHRKNKVTCEIHQLVNHYQ